MQKIFIGDIIPISDLDINVLVNNNFSTYESPWIYRTSDSITRIQYASNHEAFRKYLEPIKGRMEAHFKKNLLYFTDKLNFMGGYKPHYDLQDGWDQFADNFYSIAIPFEKTSRFSFAVRHQYTPKSIHDYNFTDVKWVTPTIEKGEALLFTGRELHKTAKDQCPVWVISFTDDIFFKAGRDYKLKRWIEYPPGNRSVKPHNTY